jgi:cobalt-zinc-cadmium efflux system protein
VNATPHDHHDSHAHGHDHDDAHAHAHRDAPVRKLAIALGLTASFFVAEALVGWRYGSLALLADAGHMLSDAGALGLALYAQRIAGRERTRHRTFGFRRAEVLAAFVNGVALGAASLAIVVEAVRRWRSPPPLEGRAVLVTAVLGLAVNIAAAFVLARGDSHNLNTRAALAHVMADAIGSVGAILAALAVIFFGWMRADPAISIGIALLLAYGAWHLVSSTVSVLMEGAPASVNLQALETCVRETPGVHDVHDLHAWTISEGFHALTVHVVLATGYHGTDVAQDVSRRIRESFPVDHVTVQPERKPPSLIPPDTLRRKREDGP